MNKLYVGKVVGTHGIKGEIKIFSDLDIKDKILKKDTILYFNDSNKEYKISSVRIHKGNYLVLLDGYNNINDVLFLNKNKVYVNRDLFLKEDEYVLDDLIGFSVIFNDKEIGIIKDYDLNTSYATFLVEGEKKIYLPNVSNYIQNIDLENKKVYTKNVGDLLL
jgi:16S rRNA processing protein RimM